jgi:hypothetical protein
MRLTPVSFINKDIIIFIYLESVGSYAYISVIVASGVENLSCYLPKTYARIFNKIIICCIINTERY